jgi:hypothetical protein
MGEFRIENGEGRKGGGWSGSLERGVAKRGTFSCRQAPTCWHRLHAGSTLAAIVKKAVFHEGDFLSYWTVYLCKMLGLRLFRGEKKSYSQYSHGQRMSYPLL